MKKPVQGITALWLQQVLTAVYELGSEKLCKQMAWSATAFGSVTLILLKVLSAFKEIDPEVLYKKMAKCMIAFGAVTFILLQRYRGAYGRYAPTHEPLRHHAERTWLLLPSAPARLAWFIQECPSFLMPIYFTVIFRYTSSSKSATVNFPLGINPQTFLLGLFLLHYFQRSFVFPLLIRGGKPMPLLVVFGAAMFCAYNGIMQYFALATSTLDSETWTKPHFLSGCALFFTGMWINLHADAELRSLRSGKDDKSYKIPQRGMFRYVTAANYFGEWVEWIGFALACWNSAAVAFAFFTVCNIGPRAAQHHAWYKQKFENYPESRKIFIPFVF